MRIKTLTLLLFWKDQLNQVHLQRWLRSGKLGRWRGDIKMSGTLGCLTDKQQDKLNKVRGVHFSVSSAAGLQPRESLMALSPKQLSSNHRFFSYALSHSTGQVLTFTYFFTNLTSKSW